MLIPVQTSTSAGITFYFGRDAVDRRLLLRSHLPRFIVIELGLCQKYRNNDYNSSLAVGQDQIRSARVAGKYLE